MKGPLHAIRRRRSERPAEGVDTAQVATEAPTEAQPVAGPASAPPQPAGEQAPPTVELGSTPPPTAAGEQATASAEAAADVPAGQEPIPDRPSFRQRGRMRRRLRYLRRVRELGFRDLGGLVFDQHRFNRANPALVEGKLHALGAVDHELRTLEHALDDRRPLTELREPGISVCPRCGALHGSEARYCPSCGTAVHGSLAIAEVGEAVSLPGGEIPHALPAPPPAQPVAPAPLHLQPVAPESHAAPPPPAQALWQHTTPQPTAPAEQILPQPSASQPIASQPAASGEHVAPEPATSADPRLAEQQAAAERHSPAEDRTGAEQHAGAEQRAGAGDQPTEVMNRVDEQTANGEAEAVAQRGGERREP